MPELNDLELVQKYLNGDQQTLEILIGRYLKPIYNFSYHYVGNAQDAEDITQDVFIRVWRHLKKYNQTKSFKTWVFSFAKNASIDFLRKKKAIPFANFEYDEGDNGIINTLADPEPLPSDVLERQDIRELLASVFGKLPLNYREVLSLYYQDDFNFREIAEVLGGSVNTIKSQHRRALILLKKLLVKPF